jgi:hypothetical protein
MALDGVMPDKIDDPCVCTADLVDVFISAHNPDAISVADVAKLSLILHGSASS